MALNRDHVLSARAIETGHSLLPIVGDPDRVVRNGERARLPADWERLCHPTGSGVDEADRVRGEDHWGGVSATVGKGESERNRDRDEGRSHNGAHAEESRPHGPLIHDSAWRLELRVMREDRPLEVLQLTARFEPEVVAESAARVLVGGERLGLPARAVEGEHQLSAKPFPKGVLADERLQLRDELVVAAERELEIDAVQEPPEPLLLEPLDLVASKRTED